MFGVMDVDPQTVEQAKLIVLGYVGAGALKVGMAPFDAAADRLKKSTGDRIDDLIRRAQRKARGKPLGPSTRTAVKVLSEAAWNDDEIVAEYLGGVLAASDPGDDAGVSVSALIGRLSGVHLRLHYIVYREIRRAWPTGEPLRVYDEPHARRAAVKIPLADLIAALPELPAGGLNNAIETLRHEHLIGAEWSMTPDGEEWAYRVAPSGLGAELFLWGHGIHPPAGWRLVEPDLEFDGLDVPETLGATLLQSRPASDRPELTQDNVQAAMPDILVGDVD
jgi:hypothetical protein